MNIDRTYRSPNYNARPHHVIVDTVVLHADGSKAVSESLSWCCDRASKVSYHTIIGRHGDIYEMVDPNLRAWHAGTSEYQGVQDCNNYSIGVCLSNCQDGQEPFTEAAMRSGAEYVAYLIRHFPAITVDRIVMHSDVATPAGRKVDPAPAGPFDLALFRQLVLDERAATMHV